VLREIDFPVLKFCQWVQNIRPCEDWLPLTSYCENE